MLSSAARRSGEALEGRSGATWARKTRIRKVAESTREATPETKGLLEERARRALTTVAGIIIPASEDGRMPGAERFDVWAYVCSVVPECCEDIRNELEHLGRLAEETHGIAFDQLDPKTARAFVHRAREHHHAFLGILAAQVAACYYQQDEVLVAIGMEPRPPFPRGYEVVPGDFSLLEPVRAREPLYRPAEEDGEEEGG